MRLNEAGDGLCSTLATLFTDDGALDSDILQTYADVRLLGLKLTSKDSKELDCMIGRLETRLQP